MLILRLWNYIRGYVIIVIEGYFLEKFMNICVHRQIYLWDAKKRNATSMTLKISIKGFRSIREVARKTNSRVRIVRKKGLPFLLHRYEKRKTFFIGALAFVLIFYVLTSFIWVVEVSGNKKIESEDLVRQLSTYGIKPGVLKFGVNTANVAQRMMLERKDLAWISVSVKGTKIKVKVVEREQPPEIVPKNVPSNLIAAKDAIVKQVIAKTGQGMVKAGDTVSKGDILVSGTIISENKEVPPKRVHVIGTVTGRTWYERTCPVKTRYQELEKTGKVRKKYSLVLFTKVFRLFGGKKPDSQYEEVEHKSRLSIGKDLQLPFEWVVDHYYEQHWVEKEVSLEEAKNMAAETSYREAAEEIPADAEIIDTRLKFIENEDGSLTADTIIECVEDIGIQEKIGGD